MVEGLVLLGRSRRYDEVLRTPEGQPVHLIMVSEEFRTEHAGYHYTAALSVSSDHGLREAAIFPG